MLREVQEMALDVRFSKIMELFTDNTIKARVAAYDVLVQELRQEETPQSSEDLIQLQRLSQTILPFLLEDIASSDATIVLAAMRVAGLVSGDPAVIGELDQRLQEQFFNALLSFLSKSPSMHKRVAALPVWLLSVQAFDPALLEPHVKEILEYLVLILQNHQSATIELEVLNSINRLLVQLPDVMMNQHNVVIWAPIIYLRLAVKTDKVRERAIQTIMYFIHEQHHEIHNFLPNLIQDMTKIVVVGLEFLSKNGKILEMLMAWRCVIAVVGVVVCSSFSSVVSLTNTLFSLIVPCFTHADINVQNMAIDAWDDLIMNMKTVLHKPSRMNVIMKPLLYQSKKSLLSGCRRISSMWLIMQELGDNVQTHIHNVFLPFLERYFCSEDLEKDMEAVNMLAKMTAILLRTDDSDDLDGINPKIPKINIIATSSSWFLTNMKIYANIALFLLKSGDDDRMRLSQIIANSLIARILHLNQDDLATITDFDVIFRSFLSTLLESRHNISVSLSQNFILLLKSFPLLRIMKIDNVFADTAIRWTYRHATATATATATTTTDRAVMIVDNDNEAVVGSENVDVVSEVFQNILSVLHLNGISACLNIVDGVEKIFQSLSSSSPPTTMTATRICLMLWSLLVKTAVDVTHKCDIPLTHQHFQCCRRILLIPLEFLHQIKGRKSELDDIINTWMSLFSVCCDSFLWVFDGYSSPSSHVLATLLKNANKINQQTQSEFVYFLVNLLPAFHNLSMRNSLSLSPSQRRDVLHSSFFTIIARLSLVIYFPCFFLEGRSFAFLLLESFKISISSLNLTNSVSLCEKTIIQCVENFINFSNDDSLVDYQQPLWRTFCQIFTKNYKQNFDAISLNVLDDIIVKTLTSNHRSFVFSTIEMWIETFDKEPWLTYSPELEKQMQSLYLSGVVNNAPGLQRQTKQTTSSSLSSNVVHVENDDNERRKSTTSIDSLDDFAIISKQHQHPNIIAINMEKTQTKASPKHLPKKRLFSRKNYIENDDNNRDDDDDDDDVDNDVVLISHVKKSL